MAIDLQRDNRGGLVPWAGVAAPLPGAHQQDSSGKDEIVPSASSLDGQAFCFLPLPCQTGEPLRQYGTILAHSDAVLQDVHL